MAEGVVPNLPPRHSLEDHVKNPGLVEISSNLHQSEVHEWVKSLGDTDSQELFDNLDALFKQQENNQGSELYFIEKLNGWKKHNRASSVLTKGLYNMFYLPVWASAYSERKKQIGFGYVMYPKLTSVKDMLVEVCNEDNDLNQALRMCFTSILGLDNLHTEGSHGRPQYIHRAVCLDNMYVLAVKNINDKKVYGEAMLKLGEITKELDDGYQGNSWHDDKNLFEQYFHHPEAYNDPKMHTLCHDYFSYGVYILEVLSIALKEPFDRDAFTTVEDKVICYNKVADKLEEPIKNKHPNLSTYLEIAKEFLNVAKYKPDKEMTYISVPSSADTQPTTYHHGYPLNNHTSRLLAAIEENKGPGYEEIQEVLKKNAVCQSCLIRLSVPLPTRCYQRDSEQRCTLICKGFYCLHCYREGERLFCRSHGTTSPMLGQPWSYALLMYGEDWNGDDKQVFETNAKFLANLMKLRSINGVPKQNVLVRSLISKDPKVELKAHCKEIQDLIHREVTIRCGETGEDIKSRTQHQTESTECSLTLAYIGHGTKKCKEDRGAWQPTKDGKSIEKSDVDRILGTIRDCETAKCKASLISFTYIKDHCYPYPASPDSEALLATSENTATERSREPYIVIVSSVASTKTRLGDITDFIGRLQTSSFEDYNTSTLYDNRNRIVAAEDNRMAPAENSGVHPMDRDLEKETDILKHKIKSGIKCDYLTAKELHNLSAETFDFYTDPKPNSISSHSILAYYNHGGLKNREFAWNPDDLDLGDLKDLRHGPSRVVTASPTLEEDQQSKRAPSGDDFFVIKPSSESPRPLQQSNSCRNSSAVPDVSADIDSLVASLQQEITRLQKDLCEERLQRKKIEMQVQLPEERMGYELDKVRCKEDSFEEDSDDEDESALEEFLRSCAIEKEYKPIPPQLIQLIYSKCGDLKLECVVISQSTENWRHLLVAVVNPENIDLKLKEVQKDNPEFKDFEITVKNIKDPPKHESDAGDERLQVRDERLQVNQKTKNRGEIEWLLGEKTSRCELIVRTSPTNRDNKQVKFVFYAVVPAHLVMTKDQKNRASKPCSNLKDMQKEIQEAPTATQPDDGERLTVRTDLETAVIAKIRLEVEQVTSRVRHSIQIHNETEPKFVDLKYPPLFCYRQWFYQVQQAHVANLPRSGDPCPAARCPAESREVVCHHLFTNDIALLPLEEKDAVYLQEILEARVLPERRGKIFPIRSSNLQQFTEENAHTIKVNNLEGTLRPPIAEYSPDHGEGAEQGSKQSGIHLTFVLNEDTDTLEKGDCGAIVYLVSKEGVHRPIGMYVGKMILKDVPRGFHKPTYKAIVLPQAFKDLQEDYPHHITRLIPFGQR